MNKRFTGIKRTAAAALSVVTALTALAGTASAKVVDGNGGIPDNSYTKIATYTDKNGVKYTVYKHYKDYYRLYSDSQGIPDFTGVVWHTKGKDDTIQATMSVTNYNESGWTFSTELGFEAPLAFVQVTGHVGYDKSGTTGKQYSKEFAHGRNLKNDPTGKYKISLLQDYHKLRVVSSTGSSYEIAANKYRAPYSAVLYSPTGNPGTWARD